MILVSVFDKVSGLYAAPQVMQNIECAKRWFLYVVGKSDLVASDLELYLLGGFDQTKGLTEVLEKPELIGTALSMRGEANEAQE